MLSVEMRHAAAWVPMGVTIVFVSMIPHLALITFVDALADTSTRHVQHGKEENSLRELHGLLVSAFNSKWKSYCGE
jgi:hypothetical protein